MSPRTNESTDRICVVTGAAGALGSEITRRLVRDGYRVAAFDVEAAHPRLSELSRELGESRVHAVAANFSVATSWDGALQAVERHFGARPSYAALVAGGYAGGAPLHAASNDDVYARMMTMNADTVHHALRALLPSMVTATRGSIVVMGSRAVERPWTSAGSAAYAASKAAVVAMAEAAAAEVRAFGVRINAVLPSTLDTPANRAAMPDADPASWVPLASAAAVIAFLLSDDARDISGARIPLYGRS